MQCVFLFKDGAGRLPTAEDLLRCGFRVSAAAGPAWQEAPQAERAAFLALAAEAPAPYPTREPQGPGPQVAHPDGPRAGAQQPDALERGVPSAEASAPGA